MNGDVLTTLIVAGGPVALFAGSYTLAAWRLKRELACASAKPELESWTKMGPDYLLTYTDGSQYRGFATIWNRWPSGARAGTSRDCRLFDDWKRIKWGHVDEKREQLVPA